MLLADSNSAEPTPIECVMDVPIPDGGTCVAWQAMIAKLQQVMSTKLTQLMKC